MSWIKKLNPFSKKAISQTPIDRATQNKLNYAFFRQWALGTIGSSEDPKFIIENAYRKNVDVYSVINMITNRASQIQWNVYELKDRKKLKEYEGYVKAGNVEKAILTKAKYWEVSENKALNKLINNPNPTQSWSLLVQEALGYKLLTGNRYLYQLRPTGSKQANELYILPSHLMTVNVEGKGNYLNRENITYVMDTDQYVKFTKDEIFHSKYWNPALFYNDFAYGLSPLVAAMGVVEKSNDSYKAAAFSYKNMGIAGILSQGPAIGEDGGIWEETQAEGIQLKLDNMAAGVDKTKKILATSASVSWQNLGLSPVDLAIIESQRMDREQICNIYRVPVQLMNSQSSSTYDNMTQSERSFYLNAIIPELCDLRDVLNNWIVPAFNVGGKQYYIDFDIKSIPALQADLEKLSKRLVSEADIGLWTRNEVRIMLGEEAFDKQPEIMDKIILNNKYLPKPQKDVPKP